MSLYENINKRRRSGKKMRKKGDPGAPKEEDFAAAARTAKNMKTGGLTDLSGDDKVTRKDYLIQVGAKGFKKNMDMGTGGNVCKTRRKMSIGGKMKNYASEGKKYGGSANMPNPRKPMGTT
tara:strand:+ start:3390 stop:3752 length:363 start_codon:yes stop_codon:yes gene_type:complete